MLIVTRIQNAFFALLATAELIVRAMVSLNKIQRAARSNKHIWNWTVRCLKLWDLNERKIRSSHHRCSVKVGVLKNFANFTWKRDSSTGDFLWNWRKACNTQVEIFKKLFLKNNWKRLLLTDDQSCGLPCFIQDKKCFSNIYFPSIYRWCIFWFYKIVNMHSFRVQL